MSAALERLRAGEKRLFERLFEDTVRLEVRRDAVFALHILERGGLVHSRTPTEICADLRAKCSKRPWREVFAEVRQEYDKEVIEFVPGCFAPRGVNPLKRRRGFWFWLTALGF